MAPAIFSATTTRRQLADIGLMPERGDRSSAADDDGRCLPMHAASSAILICCTACYIAAAARAIADAPRDEYDDGLILRTT